MLIAFAAGSMSWLGSAEIADWMPRLPRWVARTAGLALMIAVLALWLTFNPLEPR